MHTLANILLALAFAASVLTGLVIVAREFDTIPPVRLKRRKPID